MAPDQAHQWLRTDLIGRETGDEITGLMAGDGPPETDLGIDPQDQFNAGE